MRIAFQAGQPRPRPGAALVLGVRPGGGAATAPVADEHGRVARALGELKPEGVVCLRGGAGWERVLLADTGGEPRALGGRIAAAVNEADRAVLALGLPAPQAAEVAYGLALRARGAARLTSRDDPDQPAGPSAVTVLCDDPSAAATRHARLAPVAQAVGLARDLVAAPGNLLRPRDFARHAEALAPLGVDVEVFKGGALRRRGLNLLAAVGRASATPPRLAVLRWDGARDGRQPLVLVGKGITFDSGGLSIKRGESLHGMKGDMGGAAAVLGAVRALAARRAPVHVAGVLALAENMPGGDALRPGDVLRSYAGCTVEVVDTDAEGRLVLADALAWAAAELRPAALIDLATLTGAIITTLGRHRAGLFANDDALAERLLRLGEAEGERLWRLPLSAAADEDLKSPIADLRNCAWGRVPDALHAARFLERFVPPGVPWAHLDIAGVAETAEDLPLSPKGPTGFGVRLLDALAEEFPG